MTRWVHTHTHTHTINAKISPHLPKHKLIIQKDKGTRPLQTFSI
ncbi:rCG26297 [Rattus norvegicus]|uniref:RCG26297 n=1 Tax=Rattus norvegicus TaxID=10116 RepID=A6HNE4_RAT|nr:rCG26297 [Rattus norvegicus]